MVFQLWTKRRRRAFAAMSRDMVRGLRQREGYEFFKSMAARRSDLAAAKAAA